MKKVGERYIKEKNGNSPKSAVTPKIFDNVFSTKEPASRKSISSPIPVEIYAMKVMIAPTPSTTTNSTQMNNAQAKIDNEINILKSMDHPNVLKYIDQFYLKIGMLDELFI